MAEWLGRLPTVILFTTLGFILGQRLGLALQASLTTDRAWGACVWSLWSGGARPIVLHHVYTG